MPSTPPNPSARVAALTPAQLRIVVAGHQLFTEQGISATSLQMIADALGVTKAAVYHQFRTKDEIVLAVTATELVNLELALVVADTEPDADLALDGLIQELVIAAVQGRRRLTLLQHDPMVTRVLNEHEPFRDLMDRLYAYLSGERGGTDSASGTTRVRAAMVATAIGACSVHPLVDDLDDEVLQHQMLHFARQLVRLPCALPAQPTP